MYMQKSRALPWTPESKGDAIEGTLIGYTSVGSDLRAAIIREDTGQDWTVLTGLKVLNDKWNKLNPQPGMRVKIVFGGERQSKSSGYVYKDFGLTVSC